MGRKRYPEMTFKAAAPDPPHREQVTVKLDSAKMRQAVAESEDEDQLTVRMMAMAIPDEQALEDLLRGASPDMRAAMLREIEPYLSFQRTVVEVTPDCPVCGLRRGSAVSHECLTN